MATINKEIKEEVLQQLNYRYGQVTLKCGNDEICLKIEPIKALKLVVAVWVNGQIKGQWLGDDTCPEYKYMRKSERFIYKASFRQKAKKELGVRRYKSMGYDDKTTVVYPWFNSGKSAIDHLCKVCDSIEVLHIGYKL